MLNRREIQEYLEGYIGRYGITGTDFKDIQGKAGVVLVQTEYVKYSETLQGSTQDNSQDSIQDNTQDSIRTNIITEKSDNSQGSSKSLTGSNDDVNFVLDIDEVVFEDDDDEFSFEDDEYEYSDDDEYMDEDDSYDYIEDDSDVSEYLDSEECDFNIGLTANGTQADVGINDNVGSSVQDNEPIRQKGTFKNNISNQTLNQLGKILRIFSK